MNNFYNWLLVATESFDSGITNEEWVIELTKLISDYNSIHHTTYEADKVIIDFLVTMVREVI